MKQIVLAALVVVAMAMSGTTGWNTALASTPYTWKPVIAGGGGFIPGIIYHPTAPGLSYARTDMGGAYRWDNSLREWIPLLDSLDRTNSDYMGVLSIAVDPNDTNLVYMMCGKYTQSWAGVGAILSSSDRGATWVINPLSVKVGGNEDGRGAGERLQVDPNLGSILFMGTTANGLWKSTTSGTSWSQVTTYPDSNINFVILDSTSGTPGSATQRIFVASIKTDGTSLYASEDGGSTWTAVSGQPSGVMGIRACIADTLMYITFSNYQGPNSATSGSVWKYGLTSGSWTDISPTTGSFGFSGVSLYPRNPQIAVVSTLDRWSLKDDIYLTTNGGSSWISQLSTATMDYSYAGYTSSITPHWIACVAMDPFDSSKAMFGTGYGIWGTDNLGASGPTWYFKDKHLEETVPMQLISPPFTNLLSAMGDYDGFRHDSLDVSPSDRYSTHAGSTLSISYAGLVPSKVVKAFNAATYGGYSLNGGTSWTSFVRIRGAGGYPSGTTAGGTWSMAVSADGLSIVWAPTGAAMSYSKDNGKTWTSSTGGVPLVPPVADRVHPRRIFAYNSAGQLWVSSNAGMSFTKVLTGLPSVSNSQDGNLTATPNHDGDIWICCGDGGLYHSTNAGTSAPQVTSVQSAYRLGFGRGLNAGDYPAIYLFGKVSGALGFFRSDDEGSTWTRINDNAHQYGWVHQITGDMRVYGRCYVSAEGRGIVYGEPTGSSYASTIPGTFSIHSYLKDSLQTAFQQLSVGWTMATDPNGNALTYTMHFYGDNVDTTFTTTDTSATFSVGDIQPSTYYILTGYVTNGDDTTASTNHLELLTTSELTGIQSASSGIPAEYAMSQNYPNPFNPTTTVAFALPASNTVTVKVFDVLGREVATLVNGEKMSAGTYKMKFDGSRLASGVYFCRLTAGSFTATRKMVLAK